MSGLGVVVIGRNEGPRLVPALRSALALGAPVVYVDSASSDGSSDAAASLGAEVVRLVDDGKLSAARARNAGFAALPDATMVLFVDGDCTVSRSFVDCARQRCGNDGVVAVCGTRVELHPRRNIFHRICHVEWSIGGMGDVDAFGGDVLIDAAAFATVGGYDESLIAGEDPECAARLREAGGRILRLDMVSTTHDIDMAHVSQWWRRAERGGWAFGAVWLKRRNSSAPMYQREVLRTLAPPCAVLVGVAGWAAGRRLPLIVVVARIVVGAVRAAAAVRSPADWRDRAAWGLSCALASFPGTVGVLRAMKPSSQAPRLIEYRSPRRGRGQGLLALLGDRR